MTPAASWSPVDFRRAFNRAREAWEATSPQLTIEGWADVLDAADVPGAVRCVEPACLPPSEGAGGFELQECDGPDALASRLARRGQKGA